MYSRIALLVVGLAGLVQAHDVISTKITWTKEISRLVYKNCVSCHRESGPSFSLTTYEAARPWAKAIKEEVLTRRMPPWNAVKGFGEFADDKGLTQEQIALFADWVEGGAPEGDPAYLPRNPRLGNDVVRAPSGTRILVTGTRTLAAPAAFIGIQPGTIPAGGAIQVTATLPDGSVEPLLWVQSFNPGYNQPYRFKSALKFPAGTIVQTAPASARASLIAAPVSRSK